MSANGSPTKRSFWVLGPIALLAALTTDVLLVAAPAFAACPAPAITLEPTSGHPGSAFTILGQYFFTGCNDVSSGGATPPAEPPDHGVVIKFVQGGRSWTLTTVDANSSYVFETRVRVPFAASQGVARVTARGDNGTAIAPFAVLGGGSALPATGSGLNLWMTLVGLSLLAVGLITRRTTRSGASTSSSKG